MNTRYNEAVKYLESLIDYEKLAKYDYKDKIKLDRVYYLLNKFGNPQSEFKSIHIAGTKGKGSVCAYLHSILNQTGLKIGLYTSPHLIDFRERIKIGNSLISEDKVNELVSEIKPVVTECSKRFTYTFFEVYTAMAFLYFARERVDAAVIETGLGGRLDATNVLSPLLSILTPINYDHTHLLGKTLKEIAKEKAGIIKSNSIVLISEQKQEVTEVIEDVCKQCNVNIIKFGNDKAEIRDKQEFDYKWNGREYKNIFVPLLGHYQIENAGLAITAVELVKDMLGINVSEEQIKRGIKRTVFPGRMEVLQTNPVVLLDGAQNQISAKQLAKAIKEYFSYEKMILILGICKDKDIKGISDELIVLSDRVILTAVKNPRAASPTLIREKIKKEFLNKTEIVEDVDDAVIKALSYAEDADIVLITGSFYLIGEVKQNYETAKIRL